MTRILSGDKRSKERRCCDFTLTLTLTSYTNEMRSLLEQSGGTEQDEERMDAISQLQVL